MDGANVGDLLARKYRLLRRIGEGGMGEVWAARNERIGREVAVKLLLPSLARNEEAVSRFMQEARAAGQLRHPGIVDVLDAGRDAGKLYLVMELLAGESLEARLARQRTLAPVVACVIGSRVARALAAAHARGIVHRDLTTPNIFLTRVAGTGDEVPKILDFGVSKILARESVAPVKTGGGALLGSPAFMSPEQARGAETVDSRTDVWSLGVVLYQCLAGALPYEGANYNALLFSILHAPHTPIADRVARLDPALAALVEDCLIKDREARLGSAEALAARLEHAALRLAGPAAGDAVPRRRLTDHLEVRAVEARFTRTAPAARLPGSAIPLTVRLWQTARARTPAGWAIGASSLLAGVAIGAGVDAGAPPPGAEPPPSVAALAALPGALPAAVATSAPPACPVAARPPATLVELAAAGLGLPRPDGRPPSPPASPATRDAPPLRPNPYAARPASARDATHPGRERPTDLAALGGIVAPRR